MTTFLPKHTGQIILCCQCGTAITPNPSNMCIQCLRSEVDITAGIPKQITLSFCRNCERYLQPPNQWLVCELESKELLSLFLKKLKGLSKVRLVDAGFVWTEPHSKRIKVKLTIQQEVFASTILQQVFVVEGVVVNQQCDACDKLAAENTWKAVVQIRQKVSHKRTFLFLEQLMLKYNAHKETINIKEMRDGLDLFYGQRNHAIRMVEFLQSVIPIRYKTSEQIISSDIHTGTATFKFTYSVEIVPICKDDLLCLPTKVANYLGNISRLVLCSKVGNNIQLIDPCTLNTAELSSTVFWRTPFPSLCSHNDLIEYYVMDVEIENYKYGQKNVPCLVHVIKACDVGKSSNFLIAQSHLGGILKAGDLAYGYDILTANFNNDQFSSLKSNFNIPDVVLVKKSFSEKRKKIKSRTWKLKSIAKNSDDLVMRRQESNKMEEDYELFLREVEEDPEMRNVINIYKDSDAMQRKNDEMHDSDAEDDLEIPIDQLLDDLALE